jgi:tocopherol cyclase
MKFDIFHPERYHGAAKKPPFFEGWYYKLVSANMQDRLAFIPGIILGKDAHAFIQVLDGTKRRAEYFRFPASAFKTHTDPFAVDIGPNHFDLRGMELHLGTDKSAYDGSIAFGPLTPWPVRLLSPGIMGWYAWIPGMQCYHGVLGFNHHLRGTLATDHRKITFDDGKGYLEKDWGQSFPEGWIWFQSNHFAEPELSLTASIAVIPWLGASFPGFIVGLWWKRRLYRFTSYIGAKIDTLTLTPDQIHWSLSGNGLRLEMTVNRAAGSALLGPTIVDMGKHVDETLDASVRIRLFRPHGKVLLEGEGFATGLEVQGKLDKLLALG